MQKSDEGTMYNKERKLEIVKREKIYAYDTYHRGSNASDTRYKRGDGRYKNVHRHSIRFMTVEYNYDLAILIDHEWMLDCIHEYYDAYMDWTKENPYPSDSDNIEFYQSYFAAKK